MAKQKVPTRFPDELYVRIEKDGDESYLVADDDFGMAEDGEKVALYQFVEVKTKKVTHELIP